MSAIKYWAYVVVHVWWGTMPLLLGLLIIVLTSTLRRKNAEASGDALRAWAVYFGGVFLALCGVGILLLVGLGCC